MLYPLLLEPSLHIKVWGGRQLETQIGKTLPTQDPYGEAWELHETAKVTNGKLQGKTLREILHTYKHQLIGAHNDPAQGFPLLAKILDSSNWLSVQVHPNDEQAKTLEGDPRGKTEAWVILAAQPNSQLVIGVTPGTGRQTMAEAIRNNTLEDYLVYKTAQAGDVLFIPANTVHAIGPGLVIYEIQQSSDVTYRLYDWGRMGLDNKPRPLHIEKGVQVSNLDTLPTVYHPNTDGERMVMISCDYFETTLHTLKDSTQTIHTHNTFHALTCIEGETEIYTTKEKVSSKLGQTVLIPAAIDQYSIQGRGKILCSYQSKR